MIISVIINNTRENSRKRGEFILKWLSERRIETRVFQNEDYRKEELLGSDFIITLGGDGTILRAAYVLKGEQIPILGINSGHLGYLTEVSDFERAPEKLDALLNGQYIPEVRTMLHASILRSGRKIAEGLSLNDVLLTKSSGVSMIRFTVFCDRQELSHYEADGIIVATPTGSTAYNLSAGGPIISPQAPVYVMTPICSHSLNNNRPVIMEDTSEIEIRADSENQVVGFDGENRIRLEEGDRIRIRKAWETTTLVKISKGSFLSILREKMANI